jgi:phosphoribosylamine--glycine ligase
MAITDGRTLAVLEPAQDHKRIFDGDRGPNTGGMGTYSPTPVVTPRIMQQVERDILVPMIHGLGREKIRYHGVLYAGLMITKGGPRVLDFNCRFGDPETQVQMLRMEDDLADVCLRVARGNLGDVKTLNWKKEAAACIVIAVDGYPDEHPKGQEVAVDPIADDAVVVFHAGIVRKGGKLVNQAGRVASVCARAATLSEALAKAYEAAPSVRFAGARYRTDIGYRALGARKPASAD